MEAGAAVFGVWRLGVEVGRLCLGSELESRGSDSAEDWSPEAQVWSEEACLAQCWTLDAHGLESEGSGLKSGGSKLESGGSALPQVWVWRLWFGSELEPRGSGFAQGSSPQAQIWSLEALVWLRVRIWRLSCSLDGLESGGSRLTQGWSREAQARLMGLEF